MDISNRWEQAKKLKLCYLCLGDDHMGSQCSRRRKCEIDKCERTHGEKSENNLNGNSEDNENQKVEKKSENVTMTSTSGIQEESVSMRTVQVVLRNGNKKVVINALLDDASTTTYLNSDVAAELGLRGELQSVNVTVLNDQVETFESIPVEVHNVKCCRIRTVNRPYIPIYGLRVASQSVYGNIRAIYSPYSAVFYAVVRLESLDGRITKIISAYTPENVTLIKENGSI